MTEEEEPTRQRSFRELAEELVFAGIGSVALTKERADDVLDELVRRGKITRDEAREAVEGTSERWRLDVGRLGERAGSSLAGLFRELGLVTRQEHEELELRLAQLEHRLRLVENAPPPARPPEAALAPPEPALTPPERT
jgi:polyhydroxyalkanoate synthesis regulator phasin